MLGKKEGGGGGSEDFAGFFAVEYFLWFFRRSFKIRYDSQWKSSETLNQFFKDFKIFFYKNLYLSMRVCVCVVFKDS